MKRITVLFSVIMFTLAIVACSGPQTPVKELRELVNEVEMNYKSYTEDDLDRIMDRLDALDKEFAKYEYTDEEQREIGRLNGRLSAYLTKVTVRNLGSILGNFAEEIGGGMEGFFSAFDEDVDGIDTCELTDEELRERGRRLGKKLGEKTRRFAIRFGSGVEGFADGFEEEMEQLSDSFEKGVEEMTDGIE